MIMVSDGRKANYIYGKMNVGFSQHPAARFEPSLSPL